MQYYPTYTPKNKVADVFTIGIRSDNGDKYYGRVSIDLSSKHIPRCIPMLY